MATNIVFAARWNRKGFETDLKETPHMSALHPAINKTRIQNSYHAFIVEPVDAFDPANWQGVPPSYRIVEYVGQKKHRGDADAWRFLHNRQAIGDASLNRWAIIVPQKAQSA